jgi:signal recognition particle GTPase
MLNQAREFNSCVSLTGLILTKLDGTARGGAVVCVFFFFANVHCRIINLDEREVVTSNDKPRIVAHRCIIEAAIDVS